MATMPSEFTEVTAIAPGCDADKPPQTIDKDPSAAQSISAVPPFAPEEGAKVSDSYLQEAALAGNVSLVQKLLSEGTSVNAPMRCGDSDGDTFATILHVLSSQPDLPNCTEVLSEVVKMKANLNARSSIGATPLTRACLHKNVGAAELLLVYGADVKPRDDKGRDAVTCSVMLLPPPVGQDGIDAMVAREKLPINQVEMEEKSAEILTLLADKSADLDQRATREHVPLLEAINHKNHAAVVALMELGAKPRFLHEAVDGSHFPIVEHLLKCEANPFEEDTDGTSVLDVAFRRGDEEIATLLRNHIGDLERNHGRIKPLAKPAVTFATRPSLDTKPSCDSEDSNEEEGGLGLSARHQRKTEKDRSPTSSSAMRALSLRRLSKGLVKPMNEAFLRQRSVSPNRHAVWDSEVYVLLKAQCARAQQACFRLNNSKWFQAVMFTALISCLFLPDLWVLCDVEGNDGLDIILVLVLFLFIVEVVVQMIGMPSVYIGSFFFWMDLVGACSVPLDHSAVNDNLPRNFDNAVVMRAARTARLGARAGRFTKLVKLLRFLPGVNPHGLGASGGTAKTMSNALMQSLSTRVSCLIIVMVMVLPLFDLATYPENDFSMKTWMNALDFTMDNSPADLMPKVLEFQNFYNNKDYYPFEVSMHHPNGTIHNTRLRALAPRRSKNEIEIKADSGSVWAVFNFGVKNRVDALCNIVLIITIIALMMGFSLLLSNSVSAIVLLPLENLLSGVKHMASKIFTSVTSMTKKVENSGEESAKNKEELFGNETELLEKVIDKLAALNAITMKTSPIDAETLAQLGENDRAVLQGFHADQLPTIAAVKRDREDGDSEVDSDADSEGAADTLVFTLERHLEDAGIAWANLDSWDFNCVEIDERQRQLVCLCFLIFHLGLSYSSDKQQVLTSFTQAAASGYGSKEKVPYHNWYHAVDVTHGIFRMLNLCSSERFLGSHERYALIVSAMCHDIGHPGLNNPYLVETSHELAIRYNDRSPLENMHCAKLFEIVGQPKTAVFSEMDRSQYREARQVCVEAILHTDNTQHFSMVKELQMLYEMNSDVFDISLQMYQSSKIDFPPREIVEIFSDGEKKKLIRNLLLHFCDVSNPTKPFELCKLWAWSIIDEFFLQGDKEKELGITVQPLNDREKVNRPYSQVGFIEFFVAPFAFASVRLLPPLVMCTDQMIRNLNMWCEDWAATTVPTPDVEEQAKLQDRIAKLEAKYIFREGF
jgi:cAMP-specific phosphodiesterase 4